MSLDLNGKRMQTGNTSTMIFNVDIIVSYVSKFMSLQAGDIITTGTPPGVGMGMKPQLFLKTGDQMKLTIDNLGEQNSKVVPVQFIVKIISIKSHVLKYELEHELGYSQQYYKHRTAHLVEVETDEGITGWGECFGPGNIALANKIIIEKVIQPLIKGENPTNKEYIWHKVYNSLRDSGQKGMPIQALSGIDIALWDILSKKAKLPLYQLLGGKCNNQIPVYGYGMMLQKKTVEQLIELFQKEAKEIKAKNFKAMKMKIGIGPKDDLKLVKAVREAIGVDYKLMVDANHAYNLSDALYVGKGLDEMNIHWFEEPVAPEDYEGYKELKEKLKTNIAGGEAEFTKYGWNQLIQNRCVDIVQPEVCGLGGITEYLKISALAKSNFIPIINHVWGSALSLSLIHI